jgi:hypothetical protein
VKRVVITTSLAAVACASDAPSPSEGLVRARELNEEDWNETCLKAVENKGAEAGVEHVHAASKVLAERGLYSYSRLVEVKRRSRSCSFNSLSCQRLLPEAPGRDQLGFDYACSSICVYPQPLRLFW